MKFRFTSTPLKDVALGTVVDGYKITSRSHTGGNAIGYRVNSRGGPVSPFDEALLVYTDQPFITEAR